MVVNFLARTVCTVYVIVVKSVTIHLILSVTTILFIIVKLLLHFSWSVVSLHVEFFVFFPSSSERMINNNNIFLIILYTCNLGLGFKNLLGLGHFLIFENLKLKLDSLSCSNKLRFAISIMIFDCWKFFLHCFLTENYHLYTVDLFH